jgi:hypothetical protein
MAIAQHPGVTVTLGGLLDRLVENGDASVEISVPLARGRLLFVPDEQPTFERSTDGSQSDDVVTIRVAAGRLGVSQKALHHAVTRDAMRSVHTPFKRTTGKGGEPYTAPWCEVPPWLADHRARHPKANLGA